MGNLLRTLCLVIMIFPLFIIAQNQESVLTALRKSNTTAYKGQSRVLFLTTPTIKDLQTVFPGTDKTCEYILRYYFYTEIHLNKKSNVLFAMDGTKFHLDKRNTSAVSLTASVISLIGGMFYGNSEMKSFLEQHPKVSL
tara:strand:- start:2341 stop:2757 length:417 start_codon:yes stop_codon:yes gene_type:complete